MTNRSLRARARYLASLLVSFSCCAHLAAAERDVPLTSIGRLEVYTERAVLLIVGTERSGLRLRGEHLDGVDLSTSGGVLQIREGAAGEPLARLEIELPSGHDLLVEARFAPVTVTGVHGNVTVRHASGAVRLQDIAGDVDVVNRYERIAIESVTGDVRAESFGQDVEIADVTGDVWARSAANRVVARRVGGQRVELSSVSGHVTYQGPVQARGRYQLSSHLGVVRMELPGASDATVVLSGRTEGVEVSGASLTRTGEHSAEVRLGNGRARVEIFTLEGAVQVIAGASENR